MFRPPPKLLALSQPFAGMRFLSILRTLHRAGWRISPWFLHRLVIILGGSLLAAPLRLLEVPLYNRHIQRTRLEQDPLFILGHWRSGTTFLHNLLWHDPQWGYVSTFQTFFPEAAILGHKLLRPVMQLTLPAQRPMDAVELHADMPQEEEFALAHMSDLSYYTAFFYLPKQMRWYCEHQLGEDRNEADAQKWAELYDFLLRKFTFIQGGKPLVLKNPPNTARVDRLLALYPQAKFIYLHRNPYEIYFSTLRMLEKVIELLGVQRISREELSQTVLKLYPILITRFFAGLPNIPRENFISLEYEQLKENPLQVAEVLYDSLKLPGFEAARPKLKEFLASQKSYRPARYDVDDKTKRMIDAAWGDAIRLHDQLADYPKISLQQLRTRSKTAAFPHSAG